MPNANTSKRAHRESLQPHKRTHTTLATHAKGRAKQPKDSVGAAAQTLGGDPFLPFFDRYGIDPGVPDAHKRLNGALLRRHPDFVRGRGRPRTTGLSRAKWQDQLFYAYVEQLRKEKKRPASWVVKQHIGKRRAFRNTTEGARWGMYQRGKKTFEDEHAGKSEALKQLRIEILAEIVGGEIESGKMNLDALARSG